MKTLKAKTAVVTGGGNGIGRSMALALADAGANVVIADIRVASAEATAAEARRRRVRALAVATDVTSRESVENLADRAYREFGAVDVLCNNAGVNWRPFRAIHAASLEDWRFIFNINLFGVVHGLDAFLPRMRQQAGEKHIVNTASLVAMVPLAGIAAYCASKAAVASLSETLAKELAPFGFGVTIVCPGVVKTEFGGNSEALRPENERGSSRVFAPIQDPLQATLNQGAIEPDDVGRMVCNAILDGTLYLHTHGFPDGLAQSRMDILFGPHTLGRV
jgi:NAD(P)-dependent dehydrogenase (short-subunit alcohol dehydrogenase family)